MVSSRRSRQAERQQIAAGLDEPITIQRDHLGIPQIIAASWGDAMFGFGFAVASDRLWQMDLWRRAATGRLSEVFGPQTLESDRMMRLIGMPRIVHRMTRMLTSDEQLAVERFAAGVNHYIDSSGLPVEFRATRHLPERWEPADGLAVFRFLGWSLSGHIDADLTAEQVKQALGEEWAEAIYRGGFVDHEPIVRQPVTVDSTAPVEARRLPIFPFMELGGASNAWAVSASHSITGGALLANDPHLELRNPSIWYEVRIEAPGFRVAGMTVPGIPAVVIGKTPEIAWGVTAAATPQLFVYREEVGDDDTVSEGGERKPMQVHDEIIGVKGQPDEILRIRYTDRGPLVSDILPQPGGQTVSLHWAGMEEGHELDVLLNSARVKSLGDLLPHARDFTTPPLNVAVATAGGEIAMVSIGKMSIRTVSPGLLPIEEFPPKYVPADEMPLERNPERGWIACANNCLIDDRYPHQIYGNWDPGFRHRRIVRELESRNRHSPGDFRTLQLDVHSMHAEDIVPVFVGLLDGVVAPWIVDDLRNWDFEMAIESRPALLYEAISHEWIRLALCHRLPGDLADLLIERGGALSVPVLFVDRVLRGELPAWMDDEIRAALVVQATRQALAWIGRRLGPDPEKWNWGAVHRLTFRHPLGMVRGPHRLRVNVGPFPVPGSRHTVSPMVWSPEEPFDVIAGPSFRYVTDMKRPEIGWITNTLGQSGSPLSRHFQDQVEDFIWGFMHLLWPQGFKPSRRQVIHPVI